ncbi:unnamed protein product [Prorocentrum cordatum]|uniref:Ubiquitin-like domain-containing protein n=1 Tax=Prorocentrum cordatum TaxID=2364126 RepID=A0ABN9RDI4_9DINO|nr:unnamed protein product [Polarella glacialis]
MAGPAALPTGCAPRGRGHSRSRTPPPAARRAGGAREAVRLQVIGLSGEHLQDVEVGPRGLVSEAKRALAPRAGAPPRHLRLVFEGRELRDENTVDEEGLPDVARVSLVRSLPEFVSLLAIKEDDPLLVRFLLDAKADPNERDERGWTALHWASFRGHSNVGAGLIELPEFTSVNAQDIGRMTALLFFAQHGQLDLCERLAGRADFSALNARSVNGNTALHWAARNGHAAVCEGLLAMPGFTAVNDQNVHGWTALHYAAAAGLLSVCEKLLEHPSFAAISALTNDRETALHWAALNGRLEVCRLLADQIDARAVDVEGILAVDGARINGHAAVCAFLEPHAPGGSEGPAGPRAPSEGGEPLSREDARGAGTGAGLPQTVPRGAAGHSICAPESGIRDQLAQAGAAGSGVPPVARAAALALAAAQHQGPPVARARRGPASAPGSGDPAAPGRPRGLAMADVLESAPPGHALGLSGAAEVETEVEDNDDEEPCDTTQVPQLCEVPEEDCGAPEGAQVQDDDEDAEALAFASRRARDFGSGAPSGSPQPLALQLSGYIDRALQKLMVQKLDAQGNLQYSVFNGDSDRCPEAIQGATRRLDFGNGYETPLPKLTVLTGAHAAENPTSGTSPFKHRDLKVRHRELHSVMAAPQRSPFSRGEPPPKNLRRPSTTSDQGACRYFDKVQCVYAYHPDLKCYQQISQVLIRAAASDIMARAFSGNAYLRFSPFNPSINTESKSVMGSTGNRIQRYCWDVFTMLWLIQLTGPMRLKRDHVYQLLQDHGIAGNFYRQSPFQQWPAPVGEVDPQYTFDLFLYVPGAREDLALVTSRQVAADAEDAIAWNALLKNTKRYLGQLTEEVKTPKFKDRVENINNSSKDWQTVMSLLIWGATIGQLRAPTKRLFEQFRLRGDPHYHNSKPNLATDSACSILRNNPCDPTSPDEPCSLLPWTTMQGIVSQTAFNTGTPRIEHSDFTTPFYAQQVLQLDDENIPTDRPPQPAPTPSANGAVATIIPNIINPTSHDATQPETLVTPSSATRKTGGKSDPITRAKGTSANNPGPKGGSR